MKLSERLELVLSFVEPGESAADVGTDHGHVPVELVRRAIVKKAVAMDADPLDPQIPSMSSMMSKDSPSMNWNAKFALLERRFVR